MLTQFWCQIWNSVGLSVIEKFFFNNEAIKKKKIMCAYDGLTIFLGVWGSNKSAPWSEQPEYPQIDLIIVVNCSRHHTFTSGHCYCHPLLPFLLSDVGGRDGCECPAYSRQVVSRSHREVWVVDVAGRVRPSWQHITGIVGEEQKWIQRTDAYSAPQCFETAFRFWI